MRSHENPHDAFALVVVFVGSQERPNARQPGESQIKSRRHFHRKVQRETCDLARGCLRTVVLWRADRMEWLGGHDEGGAEVDDATIRFNGIFLWTSLGSRTGWFRFPDKRQTGR
jgi:hypothetical protein